MADRWWSANVSFFDICVDLVLMLPMPGVRFSRTHTATKRPLSGGRPGMHASIDRAFF
jgi:hypothetical protein